MPTELEAIQLPFASRQAHFKQKILVLCEARGPTAAYSSHPATVTVKAARNPESGDQADILQSGHLNLILHQDANKRLKPASCTEELTARFHPVQDTVVLR